MFKKISSVISSFLFMFFIFHGTANADKSGIIKIPTHAWSSQLVGAKVIGELMKMVGEKVEYIQMNDQTVYQSMANGDIDIVHEIWEGAFGDSYEKAKSTGGIEEILTHDAITREDWWYPEYVESMCPGLPNWKALAKCANIFARPNSGGKGVFISGPSKWLKHDVEKIEALGMNFVVKNVSDDNAIWAELDTAVIEKKPIVIFNWSPNFIGAKYAGKFVEFPKYDSKCVTDKSWGINPKALYDCGNPANGYLKLAVNKDFRINHPKGYKLIKKINFSTSDIDKMGNYINTDNLEVPPAAQKWFDEHNSKWKGWIKN